MEIISRFMKDGPVQYRFLERNQGPYPNDRFMLPLRSESVRALSSISPGITFKDDRLSYENKGSSDCVQHLEMMFFYSRSNFASEMSSRRGLATFRLRRNVAANFGARFVFFSVKCVYPRYLFIFKAQILSIDHQESQLISQQVKIRRPLTLGFPLI